MGFSSLPLDIGITEQFEELWMGALRQGRESSTGTNHLESRTRALRKKPSKLKKWIPTWLELPFLLKLWTIGKALLEVSLFKRRRKGFRLFTWFLTFFLALALTVLYERCLRLRDRTWLGNSFITSGIRGPKPGALLLQSHVLLSIYI